ITPGAWHANEGHAAFALLERVREAVINGVPYRDAIAEVRRTSIFTTHTPVPAGHDFFDLSSVIECAGESYFTPFGTDAPAAATLGTHPKRDDGQFHMTVLAIRLAAHVNGVAARHGVVSRQLW